jgi:nucleoid-associated protein YgaU
MFVFRTAIAALLTIIIAASWALIMNERVLSSTVNVPAAAQQTSPALFTPVTLPPPKALPLKVITYTVRPGDTLWGISRHVDMSWHSLYVLNRKIIGGNPNLIYPGETLQI